MFGHGSDDGSEGGNDEVAIESLVPKSSDTVPAGPSALCKPSGSSSKRPAQTSFSASPATQSGEDKPSSTKKLRVSR